MCMKLSGSHKFKAPRTQVFNAILNPQILKDCIPGCITTPLPGLKGPYGVIINIANAQAPNYIELHVQRKGTGGSVKAVSQINLSDEPDGTLLTYNANADLEGPISVADNPIGRGITNNSLGSFFKNLDKAIV